MMFAAAGPPPVAARPVRWLWCFANRVPTVRSRRNRVKNLVSRKTASREGAMPQRFALQSGEEAGKQKPRTSKCQSPFPSFRFLTCALASLAFYFLAAFMAKEPRNFATDPQRGGAGESNRTDALSVLRGFQKSPRKSRRHSAASGLKLRRVRRTSQGRAATNLSHSRSSPGPEYNDIILSGAQRSKESAPGRGRRPRPFVVICENEPLLIHKSRIGWRWLRSSIGNWTGASLNRGLDAAPAPVPNRELDTTGTNRELQPVPATLGPAAPPEWPPESGIGQDPVKSVRCVAADLPRHLWRHKAAWTSIAH